MSDTQDPSDNGPAFHECSHVRKGMHPAHTYVDHVADPERSRSELNTRTYLCVLCSVKIIQTLTAIEKDGSEMTTRYFTTPATEGTPPSDHLVSSAIVDKSTPHDRMCIWSRGALAGELVVTRGDGERIAAALGLVEHVLPSSFTPATQ